MSKTDETDEKNDNNSLLKKYLLIYQQSTDRGDELELRFGTNYRNPITKIKFNKVIQKLKSLGFTMKNSTHLNISSEFIDSKTGRTRISNIRTQITGIFNIKKYCSTNKLDLESVSHNSTITFMQKFRKKNADEVLIPIDFKEFEFRVNYKSERILRSESPLAQSVIQAWDDSKKVFRLIERFRFNHEDYPFHFDLSIVKSSKKIGPRLIPEYNIEASNVFRNQETYEIEVEFNNSYRQSYGDSQLMSMMKKSVQLILGSIQGTNYPVSYKEQKLAIREYMELIHRDIPDRNVYTSDFIGPSSISVEMINVIPTNEELGAANINMPYTVTEKADGYRALLFISSIGKIYLINTNMEVIFTGCVCNKRKLF